MTVYKLNQADGLVSDEERLSLLPAIQEMCEGLPMERISEIEVTEDEFLARSVKYPNSTANSEQSRFKRGTGEWFTCHEVNQRQNTILLKCLKYSICLHLQVL